MPHEDGESDEPSVKELKTLVYKKTPLRNVVLIISTQTKGKMYMYRN